MKVYIIWMGSFGDSIDLIEVVKTKKIAKKRIKKLQIKYNKFPKNSYDYAFYYTKNKVKEERKLVSITECITKGK